jgi:hypothetical protein
LNGLLAFFSASVALVLMFLAIIIANVSGQVLAEDDHRGAVIVALAATAPALLSILCAALVGWLIA